MSKGGYPFDLTADIRLLRACEMRSHAIAASSARCAVSWLRVMAVLHFSVLDCFMLAEPLP